MSGGLAVRMSSCLRVKPASCFNVQTLECLDVQTAKRLNVLLSIFIKPARGAEVTGIGKAFNI